MRHIILSLSLVGPQKASTIVGNLRGTSDDVRFMESDCICLGSEKEASSENGPCDSKHAFRGMLLTYHLNVSGRSRPVEGSESM